MSNFAVHGENLRKQTQAVGFFLLPIVTNDESAKWSEYLLANAPSWYHKQRFVPFIHGYTYTPEGDLLMGYSGPHIPTWQMEPLPAYPLINFDLALSDRVRSNIELIRFLGEGVVADVTPDQRVRPLWPDMVTLTTAEEEPFSLYFQPIYDTFDKKTKTLVATFQLFLPWNVYFAN
ncbi:hypothetical protein ACA910_017475 [Epithemia clementina (nom. ined.)]